MKLIMKEFHWYIMSKRLKYFFSTVKMVDSEVDEEAAVVVAAAEDASMMSLLTLKVNSLENYLSVA